MVFNSFQGLFLLVLHLQMLFHPQPLKFPARFPFVNQIVIPTPTPMISPTVTPTVTPSLLPTSSPVPTISPSPMLTPTITPSPTKAPINSPAPTNTPSHTPTPTPTFEPSVTPSDYPFPTGIPTDLPTPTVAISVSPTPDLSPTPIVTSTLTPTPSVEITPSPTEAPSVTPTPSIEFSPTPTPIIEVLGNDISYPQCGREYPVGQMFGIVGVNGGIASTTNPCLSSQLAWAAATKDFNINQPKVQLYVNTGNPGGLNTPTWPQNNIDPLGNSTSNPHGTCDSSNSVACAWQYGWNRAVEDVESRFIPAANAAGISANPASYVWWLDVETTNSWREGSSEALQANAATLEGMVSYFKSRGINPGIYSTGYQWGVIVGNLSSGSSLHGLSNWIPGAPDLQGAKAKCLASPFTSGSSVILTQFTLNNFDYDYSCI